MKVMEIDAELVLFMLVCIWAPGHVVVREKISWQTWRVVFWCCVLCETGVLDLVLRSTCAIK
jgi:hypothetical protein